MKAELAEIRFDTTDHLVKAAHDPAIFKLNPVLLEQFVDLCRRHRLVSFQVHEEKAPGVPDLVAEGAVAGHSGDRKRDVRSRRCRNAECETHCIGTIFFNDLQRVDDVAG